MPYETVFRRMLYPAYNRITGRRYVTLLHELEQSQWWPEERIRDHQWHQLKALIQHSYENVPYYAQVWREHGVEPRDIRSLNDIVLLPLVSKADLIERGEDFIARGCNRSALRYHRTGGSTGQPLVFPTDRATDAASTADFYRALRWWGVDAGTRTAMFWGSPRFIVRNRVDALKLRTMNIRHWLMNRVFFPNYDLSPKTLSAHYDTLRRFQPEVIRGMASSLYVFANYLKMNRLSLTDIPIRVTFSHCEYLYDWEREQIETTFKSPVANTYGLSEFGEVAFEYRCGSMHLMDENVFTELVDDPNVADCREVVVTHLKNWSTPLIRYRTGDMADEIGTGCPCGLGLRTLGNLKGRAHDFIIRPDGGVVHGQMFTHLVVFHDGVRKYQVIQESVEAFTVRLVVDEGVNHEAIENGLRSGVAKYVGPDVSVRFEYLDDISPEASGKYRWIVSKVGGRAHGIESDPRKPLS